MFNSEIAWNSAFAFDETLIFPFLAHHSLALKQILNLSFSNTDVLSILLPVTVASYESVSQVERWKVQEVHGNLWSKRCVFFFVFVFFNFWLCWVFVSVRGLSPVAASGGHSSSRRVGLSPSRPLPLRSTGSRRAGSAAVAHGPSRSAACGILPDQGSNPCPLHWQADSQPLRQQGSPTVCFKETSKMVLTCPQFSNSCLGVFSVKLLSPL